MSLSGRTVHTDLSELGCVSRFKGATSLCFLDLFLLFRMVQTSFFLHVAYVINDNLRFVLVFEGYPSVVIDVDYNDVVFYGMDEYF